jgi:uncharacterized protein YjiS (DUF1127 family)
MEMTVHETARPVPLGAVTTFRVVALAERALAAVRTWRAARGTEAALRRLSDRQLADIGLHRGAIPETAEALARR